MVNGNKRSKKGGKMKVSNVSGDLIGIYTVYIYNVPQRGCNWDILGFNQPYNEETMGYNQPEPSGS